MEQNDYILSIKKMFLSFTPLQKIKEFVFNTNIVLDSSTQEIILNNTVHNTLMKRYPLKMSYQKGFLKCLIQKLESENEDIIDELYNEYCNMILQSELSETHFRHFILNDDNKCNFITLQESINMISQGTTGLCSWQAASVLSEWCIKNKDKLKGKVVLELGSGVGLLGLSVIQMCSPKQFVFTDGHEKVLFMLCNNIIINFAKDCNEIQKFEKCDNFNLQLLHNDTNIKVQHLLWEDIDKWISKTDIKPDIILAADILFDSSVFPSLIRGLKVMFSLHKIKCYIAATVRNETTISDFLNQLDKYSISYQDEVVLKQNIFVHKEDTPVRIIKIF